MFIGHYGAALAAKRLSPRVSLGAFFLAVQFLDVLWASFVLAGIEKLRIVPGFTAYNSYDLYWMPYSHSLAGALIWSAAVAGGAWLALGRWSARERAVAALALGAAVFSHFLFDLPMHTRDLPLGFSPGSPKIGFGLWNHRAISITVELAAFAAGGALYLRATRARSSRATAATVVSGALLLMLLLTTSFLPDPPSGRVFAIQALLSYVGIGIAAHFVDRARVTA